MQLRQHGVQLRVKVQGVDVEDVTCHAQTLTSLTRAGGRKLSHAHTHTLPRQDGEDSLDAVKSLPIAQILHGNEQSNESSGIG